MVTKLTLNSTFIKSFVNIFSVSLESAEYSVREDRQQEDAHACHHPGPAAASLERTKDVEVVSVKRPQKETCQYTTVVAPCNLEPIESVEGRAHRPNTHQSHETTHPGE